MKKTHVIPKEKSNCKRAAMKLRRGKGRLAMEKAGKSEAGWAQAHDPLFKIKGKKRHARTH